MPVVDLNEVIQKHRSTVVMCDVEGAEKVVIPKADLTDVRALILELQHKLLSREAVKSIFDNCVAHNLYLCVEYSSEQVITFEPV